MGVEPLLMLLFKLVIIGLIFYVIYWGINKVNLPEPFGKIALVLLVVIAVYILVTQLLLPLAR